MPADRSDQMTNLENENARLKDNLRRCHALVDVCRSKLVANSNLDYPRYEQADDRREASADIVPDAR